MKKGYLEPTVEIVALMGILVATSGEGDNLDNWEVWKWGNLQ